MADGTAVLQSMIAKLRKLGDMPEETAADLAPELKRELVSNIQSGVEPDGTPWKPTQEGHIPLQGAAANLGVAAIGPKVIVALRGIHASHHYGHVRGGIARPMLPSSELPQKIVDLVTRVAERRFNIIVRGA